MECKDAIHGYTNVYVWNLGEKRVGELILRGGVSAAAGGAFLEVDLRHANLTGDPSGHGTEYHGQVVTGFADGLISGGHQKRGGDHQNEGNDSGQDVVMMFFMVGPSLNKMFCMFVWLGVVFLL